MVSDSWRFEPTIASPTPQAIPRSVGQYELLAPLGRGGMGVVYRGRHRFLKQMVAIKFIAPNAWGDSLALARFYREIQAAGSVIHPNLIRAFDAGEFDGHHLLVTEYVEGKTLQQLLKDGPLPVDVACEVIRQAALGLSAIHDSEMIHRDIKPSNLMLSADGTLKILDFGLARSLHESLESELTFSGHLLGTVDYMAPEQSTDARSVDARADLYSLGCTLYSLMTGFPPFGGPSQAHSLEERLRAHRETAPDSLQHHRDQVPDELNDLVLQLLAKNRDDRVQSAVDVAQRLEPFCRDVKLSEWISPRMFNRPDDDHSTANRREKSSKSIRSPNVETSFDGRQPTTRRIDMGIRRFLFGSLAATGIWGGVVVALTVPLGVWGLMQQWNHPADSSTFPATPSVPVAAVVTPKPPVEQIVPPGPQRLRDYSTLPPLSWRNLLSEDPIPVYWKTGDGLNDWKWVSDQEKLTVTSDETGLIGLGEINTDFEIRVGMHQINWTSGSGVFLGLQGWDPAHPDGPWKCLWVHVKELRNPKLASKFFMALSEVKSEIQNDGKARITFTEIASQQILLPSGEDLFEFAITDGNVSLLRFGGEPLQNMRVIANTEVTSIDWNGGFGVLVDSGNVTIRSCQIKRIHPDL